MHNFCSGLLPLDNLTLTKALSHLIYTLVETALDEARMRVRKAHLCHLTRSQPVLVSSFSSQKHVSKSYPSQRTRMSRLIIEVTVIYTAVQFSIIIYFILGKIVNFVNSFEELTFAAGIYRTRIN